MTDSALLSELCSICYTEKPKYRCPRCSTQTCSLPCYKRHQLRASCSGKRDPAAYLKKSQWATPPGLDQDYNYLKTVETSINRASHDVADRGLGAKLAPSRNVVRGWRNDSPLQHYLTRNRIVVEHAPKGMSRQVMNQTRPTNRGHIVWTVEWVDSDRKRTIQHGCPESSTVADLHRAMQQQYAPGKGSHCAKRKRSGSEHDTGDQTTDDQPRLPGEPEVPEPQIPAAAESGKVGAQAVETATYEKPSLEEGMTEVNANRSRSAALRFYLLKPSTATLQRVLIPVSGSSTLTAALQDRLIQEFPTIYALPEPPADLLDGYMLEMKYNEAIGHEVHQLQQHAQTSAALSDAKAMPPPPNAVDAHKILDMLKRDVTR